MAVDFAFQSEIDDKVRRNRIRSAVFGLALLAATPMAGASAQTAAPASDFIEWLTEFKQEAVRRGIRAETVEKALDGIEPIERVVLVRHQVAYTSYTW